MVILLIRIPEYGTFLLVESGIKEKFNCQIRNPGLWNLEFGSWNLDSANDGIRNPSFTDKEKNLESGIWNTEYSI